MMIDRGPAGGEFRGARASVLAQSIGNRPGHTHVLGGSSEMRSHIIKENVMKLFRFARLAALPLVLASTLALGATSASASIPTPSTTILVVHGFNAFAPVGGHIDCRDATMTAWANGLRARGFTVRTVAWYADDTNCDLAVPGRADNTVNTSIDQIAREFTNLVNNQFGATPIAISAHSLGGLIVRRALDGVEHHHSGFSANIRVTDVVTSGTPHLGTGITAFCTNVIVNSLQCQQARAGSAFLTALANNPQTTAGTDWTLVGTQCDLVVSPTSATGMGQGSGARPAVFRTVIPAPSVLQGGCVLAGPTAHDDLVKSNIGLNLIATGLRTAN